jgi:hypothetical protein
MFGDYLRTYQGELDYAHANTVCRCDDTRTRMVALARGRYQVELACGTRAWSGADLAGRAKDYAGRYAQSRRNLLERWQAAGIDAELVKVAHGRIVCVVGAKGDPT